MCSSLLSAASSLKWNVQVDSAGFFAAQVQRACKQQGLNCVRVFFVFASSLTAASDSSAAPFSHRSLNIQTPRRRRLTGSRNTSILKSRSNNKHQLHSNFSILPWAACRKWIITLMEQKFRVTTSSHPTGTSRYHPVADTNLIQIKQRETDDPETRAHLKQLTWVCVWATVGGKLR